MPYDVFKSFGAGQRQYVPGQSNTVIPVDQLLNFSDRISNSRELTLNQIEEGFSTVAESFDTVLGLRLDNDHQRSVINDLKKKYGVHEDDISLGIEDLSNPAKVSFIQKGVQGMLKDADFIDVINDQQKADELKTHISDLQGVNSGLATLARGELLNYYNTTKKERGDLSLSTAPFQSMDVDQVVGDRLNSFVEQLGLDIRQGPNGYVFVDETTGVNLNSEQVKGIVSRFTDQLRNSPAFNNNLKALIATNSEYGDPNDKTVINNYLNEVIDNYASRRVTTTQAEADLASRNNSRGRSGENLTEGEKRALVQTDAFSRLYPNVDFTNFQNDVFGYAKANFKKIRDVDGGIELEYGSDPDKTTRIFIPFKKAGAGANGDAIDQVIEEELGATTFSNSNNKKKANNQLATSSTGTGEVIENRSGNTFTIDDLTFPITIGAESGSVLNPAMRSQIINPDTGEQEDSWGLYQFNRESGKLDEFINYAEENGYGRPISGHDDDIDKWFNDSTDANFGGFARLQDDFVVNKVVPKVETVLNDLGVNLGSVMSPVIGDILFGSYNQGPVSFKKALEGLPKKTYTNSGEFAVDFANQKVKAYNSVIRKHPHVEQRFFNERNRILELYNSTKDVSIPSDFITINSYADSVPKTNLGRSSGGKVINPDLSTKKYGIMIHETGSSSASALDTFTKDSSTSAHYLVTKSGNIIQLVNDDLVAHHGGGKGKHLAKYKGSNDINANFLGIEFEALQIDPKRGTYETWTDAQLDAGAKLLAVKMIENGITKEDVMQRVLGQYETTVKAPGKKLPKSGVGDETTFLDGFDLNKGLSKKKWHGSARKSDGLPKKTNPLIENALVYYDQLVSGNTTSNVGPVLASDPVSDIDFFDSINKKTGIQ
jgi:hypothetical protein